MSRVEDREVIMAELAKASAESRKIVEDGYAGEGGYWGARKSGFLMYKIFFTDVLPMHFEDHLERLKTRREDVYGLDLMGEAQPLRDLGIKGLGVTLIDDRNVKSRARDAAAGIEILGTTFDSKGEIVELADVFSKVTRRRIRNYIKEKGIPGFDIIFCRPVGAVGILPQEPVTSYYLLQSVWNMLHPDKGLLLTQIPDAKLPFLPEWIWGLRTQGINAKYKKYELYPDGVLRLSREPFSPNKLPALAAYAESY